MNAVKILILACLTCVGSAIGFSALPDDAELTSASPEFTAVPEASTPQSSRSNEGGEVQLSISKIYWEYNATANDLGVHVFLDGEDWKQLRITNPDNLMIFAVGGFGPYRELGMTELFFEGAEPSLDDVPLEELLEAFPEGEYEFEGRTVDNEAIEGEGELSHAIPDGPDVLATVDPDDFLRISWTAVTDPPSGFPDLPINVVEYQVIVESFQVTVPASVLSVTVSPEFVGSLDPGPHQYEVLAIEENGNQTITEGHFTL